LGQHKVREKWSRTQANLEPRRSSVETLARKAFPGAEVANLASTFGGLANTNFKLELSGPEGERHVLLRYWQRDQHQAAKEIALLSLVSSRVPVPAILVSGSADPDFGLPYAFMQWIEGEPLETLAPRLDERRVIDLGRQVGATLAAIHEFRFDLQGFFGADLIPRDPLDMETPGVLAWLDHCLREGPGSERLGAGLTGALLAFVTMEGDVLASDWARQPTLTHSDFNASNILVGRAPGGAFKIAAILDWEFAFAGGPSYDFGNLLRPPLGEDAGFVAGMVDGYKTAGKDLPEGWIEASRMADLLSWVDFVSQPYCGRAVIKSARAMIRRLIAAPAGAGEGLS
jgi:aminoglycoside phosphotransferase (APT) family kinase protein